jgi:hypothetical protein
MSAQGAPGTDFFSGINIHYNDLTFCGFIETVWTWQDLYGLKWMAGGIT